MTQVQSKKQLAATVFTSMTANGAAVKRKDVIAAMVAKAGLSPAGASTYFHNFRTGLWVITTPTPQQEEVVAETSTAGEVVVEAPAEEVITEVVVEAPAEEIVAIDYSVMSKAQLVALYNTKATKHVVNFRDHATAVRRVTELFAPAAV